MNLEYFVGKNVMVQLKGNLIMPLAQGDNAIPTIRRDPNGQEGIVPMPFLAGKLLDRGGNYVVEFLDVQGAKLEVLVADDMIFSVSAVSPDRLVAPPLTIIRP